MSKSPFLENRDHLFENEVGFVIFDKFPVTKGHCLIVPFRVYPNYFDSTENEIKGLNELLFQTKDYLDKEDKNKNTEEGPEEEISEKEKKLKKDFQLQRALDLIRGLSIYKESLTN